MSDYAGKSDSAVYVQITREISRKIQIDPIILNNRSETHIHEVNHSIINLHILELVL